MSVSAPSSPPTAAVALEDQSPLPRRPAGRDTAFLDGFRGLASVYVMLSHAAYLTCEGPQLLEGSPAMHRDMSWLSFNLMKAFRFGHAAVIFFFVLSGFVIHLRYARKIAAKETGDLMQAKIYLGRRARRLYPPLLLALAITAVADQIGRHLGFGIYVGTTPYKMLNEIVGASHRWTTLLGNLAFVMHIYVPQFGTNDPLWSLALEAWFYVAYLPLLMLARRSILLSTGLVLALFVVAETGAFDKLGPTFALFGAVTATIPAWWCGVLLADVYAGRIPVRMKYLSPLVVFVGFFGLRSSLNDDWRRLLTGIGLAGLIAGCFAVQPIVNGKLRWLGAALRPLGDMSYTLYVVHFPLLVLIGGWLMHHNPTGRLPHDLRATALAAVAVMALAYAAHWLVEAPFTRRHA